MWHKSPPEIIREHAPTRSHWQTYFSIEIITTPQKYVIISKPLYILTIAKAKLNLALKMIKTLSSIKNHTINRTATSQGKSMYWFPNGTDPY